MKIGYTQHIELCTRAWPGLSHHLWLVGLGPGPFNPSKIEWDRIPTDPVKLVSCETELLDTQVFLGVRSVGPVEDFLDLTQCVLFLFSLGKSRFAVSRFAALCASFFFSFFGCFLFFWLNLFLRSSETGNCFRKARALQMTQKREILCS